MKLTMCVPTGSSIALNVKLALMDDRRLAVDLSGPKSVVIIQHEHHPPFGMSR